jgi:hypothetical protein
MGHLEFGSLGLSGIHEAATPTGVRLLGGEIPRGRHDEIWRALLERHRVTGWYPILGWDARSAALRAGEFDVSAQGPEVLGRALAENAAERMEMLRRSALEQSVALTGADRAAHWSGVYDPATVAGLFDSVSPQGRGLHRITDPYPPTTVLLVRAAHGYEVPVLVPGLIDPPNPFGAAWHPRLLPEDHLAVLRLWHDRHGAEIYYADGSDLELSVARPPTTKIEVARCAVEQSVYCDDLAQIFGEPEDVAVQQVSNYHWSFWWD